MMETGATPVQRRGGSSLATSVAGAKELFQPVEACLQRRVVGANAPEFFLKLLVQALDRRQGHTVGVTGADGLVVVPQAKSGAEILGHRPDVTGVNLVFERPGAERQGQDALEGVGRIDGFDVGFQVAITTFIERTGPNRNARTYISTAGIIRRLSQHQIAAIRVVKPNVRQPLRRIVPVD